MPRARRVLLVLFMVVGVLFVCRVSWYFFRLVYGDWTVSSARAQVESFGGYIQQGLVDGDFYVHLEETQIDDVQFEELINKLHWFPPPYLDQEHRIEIYANQTRITDRCIPLLRGLPLQALELRGTSVSDKSVPVISEFYLWKLDLSGTKITDKSVPELSQMRLLILGVSDTGITAEGMKKLKQNLPHPGRVE